MIKVFFICHGNICRSPMAEFIFKDIINKKGIEDDFYIESAATSTEEIICGIGNEVYPPARDELLKHGISCEGKRAVQLRKCDYDKYDFIIVMDSNNMRNIKRIIKNDPQNKIFKLLDFAENQGDIDDPWYTGDFTTTYNEIYEGCVGLLNYLNSRYNK